MLVIQTEVPPGGLASFTATNKEVDFSITSKAQMQKHSSNPAIVNMMPGSLQHGNGLRWC